MLGLKYIRGAIQGAIVGAVASLIGALLLWIGVGIAMWDSSKGEAAAYFAGLFFPVGIIMGILIHIRKEKKRKRKEERQRQLEDERQRNTLNTSIRERLEPLTETSREILSSLRHLVLEASTHLDETEREFEERAFSPFWDEVENATNQLAAYHYGVKRVKRNATKYTRRASRLRDRAFRLGVSIPRFDIQEDELPDARPVATRLWQVRRQAQRDFQFSMIYEQRRTNQILYDGFGTLEVAIDRMYSSIGDALGDLATSLNTTLEDLVSASNAQADTLNVLSEHVASNAQAQRGFERDSRAESERQSEMLDSIAGHQSNTSESLQALLRDIEGVIAHYEDAIGAAAASRTRQMIDRDGAVHTLSTLTVSLDLEYEFRFLRDRGQLDYSFEALITKYSCLFSSDVVEAARWRLDNADKL